MRSIFKIITCYTLILLLFLHINFVGLYCSLYALNKTDLIESVCEKKKVCCEAKCYLDKKVNEENGNTQSNSGKSNNEIKLKISEFLTNAEGIKLTPKNSDVNRIINSNKLSAGFCRLSEIPPKS